MTGNHHNMAIVNKSFTFLLVLILNLKTKLMSLSDYWFLS